MVYVRRGVVVWRSVCAVVGVAVVMSVLLAWSASASAADIYVSIEKGSTKNPGTKDAPVKNLWRVIENAKPGDVIHVAQGNYPGRGKSGAQPRIKVSNLTILGGYSPDFSKRDPFTYHTTVIAPDDSRNKTSDATFTTEPSMTNLDNIVIDGFIIDRGPLNEYKVAKDGSLDATKSPSAPAIQLMGRGGFQVRNCVIVNSSWWGIYVKCGKDSVIDNNIVFNTVGRGICAIAGGGWGKPTITVTNNTSVFSFKIHTTEGRGIYVDHNAGNNIVRGNLVAFNDESGLAAPFQNIKTIEMDKNLFYFNKYGDVVLGGQGGLAVMADEFEDELDFNSFEENVGTDPKLPLIKDWFDKYCKRKDAVEGKVTYDDLNNIRSALGLPVIGAAGKEAEYYALRYEPWTEVLKLVGHNPNFGCQKSK